MDPEPLPRLAPGRPFPPYAYVPGRYPHPERDPEGHSHGLDPARFGALPGDDWRHHEEWLHALDLLNHGFPWEAHEAFEAWWRLAARGDPRRDLLQALIKLAAAVVKGREGRPRGAATHARGAAARLASLAAAGRRLLGVELASTQRQATAMAATAAAAADGAPLALAVRVVPKLG